MNVSQRRGAPSARGAADVHGKRIDALWRISTGWADGENVPVDAILAEAATVLRPGQPFAARLSRVQNDDLVVEAAIGAYLCDEGPAVVARGTRLPLAETPEAQVVAERRSRTWSDLRAEPVGAAGIGLEAAVWRALIATPLQVGRTHYALTFLTPTPLEQPFDREDETFVEIVAAYLERTLQGSWQAERLRFQVQHDPLTGLVNRARFRYLVHEALGRHGTCGVAIVDLVDLDAINDRLGYRIGDALLVEVAAGLASRNRDTEFTGRLYGDSFGIAFPGIVSRAALERRLAAYTELFDAPFSTGDRERVERVHLAAQFGWAVAPADGHDTDALLACAAAALTPPV